MEQTLDLISEFSFFNYYIIFVIGLLCYLAVGAYSSSSLRAQLFGGVMGVCGGFFATLAILSL